MVQREELSTASRGLLLDVLETIDQAINKLVNQGVFQDGATVLVDDLRLTIRRGIDRLGWWQNAEEQVNRLLFIEYAAKQVVENPVNRDYWQHLRDALDMRNPHGTSRLPDQVAALESALICSAAILAGLVELGPESRVRISEALDRAWNPHEEQ